MYGYVGGWNLEGKMTSWRSLTSLSSKVFLENTMRSPHVFRRSRPSVTWQCPQSLRSLRQPSGEERLHFFGGGKDVEVED